MQKCIWHAALIKPYNWEKHKVAKWMLVVMLEGKKK